MKNTFWARNCLSPRRSLPIGESSAPVRGKVWSLAWRTARATRFTDLILLILDVFCFFCIWFDMHISYHFISFQIISYHIATDGRDICFFLHLVSHAHFISFHIISNHFISFHIISPLTAATCGNCLGRLKSIERDPACIFWCRPAPPPPIGAW